MPPHISIRPIQPSDFAAWKLLWDGYNAFYGREGARVFEGVVGIAKLTAIEDFPLSN